MHQLDTSFKAAKLQSAQRKRQRRLRRAMNVAFLLAGLAVVGLGLVYWLGPLNRTGPATPSPAGSSAGEPPPAVFIPAIVDLAGDPMRISLGDSLGAVSKIRLLARPDAIPADRVPQDVAVLSDTMISSSQRFMTTLPSSPSDFAFYQSQRLGNRQPAADTAPAPDKTAPPSAPLSTDASLGWASWKSSTAAGTQDTATVAPTSTEDTTSVTFVKSDAQRFKPDADIFARILVKRSLGSLFAENTLPAGDAERFDAAMKQLLDKTELDAGDVVAIRTIMTSASGAPQVVQMSLYTSSSYIGTLALGDDNAIVLGADPWVPDDLFNYRGKEDVAEPGRQYRLLDAIYSTAVRNRAPTAVMGEAIMLLSRNFDLNAFASADDQLILAYAGDDGGNDLGMGRLLYAAIKGTDRDQECYVFRRSANDDFSCFVPGGTMAPGPATTDMVTPVKGVLTAKFGPGSDPVSHVMRVNKGVDWTAPAGTPVVAAFAGKVLSAGAAAGYGNLLRIDHGGGKETWYSDLKAFADGIVPGKAVAAGDVVGYVGDGSNSAGPRLHFELHMAGAAVDPLQSAPVIVATDGSAAVETLTNRIVQVESGGVANAKNPLSSALGVGQFLSATWLRMMQTYRPDLARTMSDTDLLALRTDPTLGREMVQNLAREGEAYLKARGHQITAGRLYLCHFLGMEDADRVLSSPGDLPLSSLLSPQVISANPFLTGHDIDYIESWAEAKMGGAPVHASPAGPAAQPRSPEFELYKAAIADLLSPPPAAAPARA